MSETIVLRNTKGSSLTWTEGDANFTNLGHFTATGGTARTIWSKMRDTVSVKDFGAVGDGVTNDTAAIQSALSSGATSVYFPDGTYLINDTLLPASNQCLYAEGGGIASPNAVIQLAAAMNKPAIKFTVPGTVHGLRFNGTATASHPLQWLIYINNTNSVCIEKCEFIGGFRHIHMDGTSFYCSINDNLFYTAVESQFYLLSVTAAGCDFMMRGNRHLALPATASYSMYLNGLGSMIMSDCFFSTNEGLGGQLVMDLPATLYGGALITNCGFENSGTTSAPAVSLNGTAPLPWHTLQFVNCQITGGSGPAMQLGHVSGLRLGECGFSSTNANGSLFVSGTALNVSVVGCSHEGNAGVSPIQVGANSTISMSIIAPRWTGSAALVDADASGVTITALDVIGGNQGSNATPILLTSPGTAPGIRINNAAWTTYTPTITAGAGTFTTTSATGRFQKIGRTIHFEVGVLCTTLGTASGYVVATLPATVGVGSSVAVGFNGSSGKSLSAYLGAGASSLNAYYYDGTFPIAAGHTIYISGTYEAAA